jgi:hypothetical protein
LEQPSVRPAFVSRRHAALFAVLLAAILVFPLVIQRLVPGWRYPAAGLHAGPGDFAYLDQIANEPGDLDVVVIGDSFVMHGIDGLAIERAVAEHFHRPARVATFGIRHRGEEVYYLLLRRLLAHKKPKLIILDTSIYDRNEPHLWDYRMLKMDEGDDFYRGLTPWARWQLYTQAVLGIPRTILNELREPIADVHPADYRGELLYPDGMNGAPFHAIDLHPPTPFPAARTLFSDARRSEWHFIDAPYSPYARVYVDKLRALVDDNRVPIAILDIPLYERRDQKQVEMRCDWTKQFHVPTFMIGVPPATLFAGLDDATLRLLYADRVHFNINGAHYFTEVVTPAILEILDEVKK